MVVPRCGMAVVRVRIPVLALVPSSWVGGLVATQTHAGFDSRGNL